MTSSQLSRRQLLQAGMVLGAGLKLPTFTQATPQTTSLALSGSIKRVHDPVIIKHDDTYYLFNTGRGIPVRKSSDLLTWELAFPALVFANTPQWAQEAIPGQHDMWAPDIAYFNDKYHLYYSVSTFGKNRSLIGLVTNKSLNFKDEAYEWVDEGLVLESVPTDNYNCIDPNLVIDADGVPWLAFGSFWSGIKMRRLDYDTGKPSAEDETLYSLAQRFVNSGAVEAPFIIRKGDFYYLFVSFDFCCRGKDSTYHVVVGRSESITGPYLDRDGVSMLEGGGTQITFPTDRWRGPGHNAIFQEDGIEYLVYHSYDTENMDAPTLRIDVLNWDDEGFPFIDPAVDA
jgi:arabinan endo-1,5-alpha-L-arabinosidase